MPERLLGVLSAIGAAPDLPAALTALGRGAVELLGGDQGAVRAYDVDGRGHHVALWVRPDGPVEPDANPEPPPGSVAAALKAGGAARVIEDLWELDPGLTDEERRRKRRGMRSSVAVPIDAGGERIGSLHVDHRDPGHFTPEDLAQAELLAAHAGVVVERARQAARRDSDEAVRLSERRYRTLIEQSPLSTQVFAPDGSSLSANAAWERLWGTTRDQLEGYNVLRDPQLAAKGVLPQIERTFAGEAVEIAPVRYDPTEIGKPGRPRWVGARCYPLTDETGAVREVVLVLEDVTARMEAEEERERALAEARDAVRQRDEFLSAAAHELKTPATSLRGMAQVLLRRLEREGEEALTAERLRRGLELFDRQTVRLSLLVEHLLDVARIGAGRLALERRATDVVGLVRGAVADAQLRAEGRELVVAAPAGDVAAHVDPLRLEQVVGNLLDNAIKFSPRERPIEVEVASEGAEGEWVRIVVRDWGMGVPAERRGALFERFFQAHAEGHYGGLGLGLYISKEIVELHGGTIAAEFPEDGGSRFVVRLPRG